MHARAGHLLQLDRRATAEVEPTAMTIEELFARHGAFVWRSLRHLGVHDADLEDQTQEVFLVAYQRLDTFGWQHPRAWLYGIARRCASTYRRRTHRTRASAIDELPDPRATDDPSVGAEVDMLRRVLANIDADKRAVFLLYEVEEMSLREIAEAVEAPLQTVYTRLLAARRAIAQAIEEET